MKIITWNINSLRLRIQNVKRLLELEAPDILCLQETKVQDHDFPAAMLKSFGYEHLYFHGQKSYNGVAFISRVPIRDIHPLKMAGREDSRHMSGILPDGTELHNFYIPAGVPEPDPIANPNFAYKLRYMDELAEWFAKNRKSRDKMILVGDLNIAPHENDVWSHKQCLKVVSHTPAETDRLKALQKDLGWIDSGRHFTPMDEKLYSWWSYRAEDWQKSDRGRRLDHIWATEPLKNKLVSGYVVKEARGWNQPSDHVPVVLEMDVRC